MAGFSVEDRIFRAVTRSSYWSEDGELQPDVFMLREGESELSFFSTIKCVSPEHGSPGYCEGDFSTCFGEICLPVSVFQEFNLTIVEDPLEETANRRAIDSHLLIKGVPSVHDTNSEADARSLAFDLLDRIDGNCVCRRRYKKAK